jgi:hypothetical protein
MRNTLVLIAATVFAVAAVYVYYSSDQKEAVVSDIVSLTPAISPSVYPTEIQISPPPLDWRVFSSESLAINFSYPPKMEITENEDKTVRGVLIGPSQSLGTEVYDGIILSFSKGEYAEASLENYVESVVTKKKSDPVYIEITDIDTVQIAGINGYKFLESALGTFMNIYLPLGDGKFLLLTYLLEDPKGQGFEATLDILLNSLEFNQ